MTKENLWQIIVGIMVAALGTVTFNMGVFALIPLLVVAIAWAGIKQTSGKEYKNAKGDYEKPKFWKDFVPVIAGGVVMWLISIQ
nr:MAG TPA: hypothetical protein [Caudoviricetes sp.]